MQNVFPTGSLPTQEQQRAAARVRAITAIAACVALFFEQINYLVHTIFRYLGLVNAYTTTLLMGLFLLLTLLCCLLNIQKPRLLRAMLFPILILVLYIISIAIYGDKAPYLSQSIQEKLFLYCLPTYLLFSIQEDYQVILRYFSKFCVMSIVTQTLAVVNDTFFPQYFVETDYQGISYGLLIPTAYYICKSKKKAIDYVLIVFMCLLHLLSGGRGPIVCTLCCILFRLLLNIRKNKIWIVFTAAAITFFAAFYDKILARIITLSEQFGFAGSLIKYYNMGDMFSDSGRNAIYDISLDVVKKFPLMGTGLGGDRYWLGEMGYKYGVYPHNFFLEILLHFGCIAGGILIVLFVYRAVKCFLCGEETSGAYLLFSLLFFSNGFLGLMFSSSYLLSPSFFAMLAAMAFLHKERKQYEKNRDPNVS